MSPCQPPTAHHRRAGVANPDSDLVSSRRPSPASRATDQASRRHHSHSPLPLPSTGEDGRLRLTLGGGATTKAVAGRWGRGAAKPKSKGGGVWGETEAWRCLRRRG
ncbi:hypothetical protein TIFTF001_044101 [Ficus carica]|uniref:Uncharacterized protein n=1 Tax=Ficus carica TaxID=3494 RepID=A0AA87Z7Z5_FICCA|nr:hypothetical protein TIFTF001_044101 [Ficus carica]